MIQVSLDTSFLISFVDPDRVNHAVAVEYFRYCLAQRIPMWISVVAAGEFEVRQPINDLPLQHFRLLSYNLLHARRAAACRKALEGVEKEETKDQRKIIINDLMIIAQAEEEGISVILTEDKKTLSRFVERLRKTEDVSVSVLLLTEGFTPGRLENPDQGELPLNQQPT